MRSKSGTSGYSFIILSWQMTGLRGAEIPRLVRVHDVRAHAHQLGKTLGQHGEMSAFERRADRLHDDDARPPARARRDPAAGSLEGHQWHAASAPGDRPEIPGGRAFHRGRRLVVDHLADAAARHQQPVLGQGHQQAVEFVAGLRHGHISTPADAARAPAARSRPATGSPGRACPGSHRRRARSRARDACRRLAT